MTFLLLLSAFGCTSNEASVKTGLYEQPAIGWKEVTIPGNGITLSGILFQPVTQDSPRPAVIVLHGWLPPGYNGAENVSPVADALAHSGFVALALSMRGWPNTGGENDCGLRQSRDIDDVVRWLRSQESVDPTRLALFGMSQGGLVALLAGSRDGKLKAIVAYYAPVDLDDWQVAQPGTLAQAFGQACQPGTPERSPINAAGSMGAPVLLVYGKRDQKVPLSQGKEMAAALVNHGAAPELIVIDDEGHGFPPQWSEAWPATLIFLRTRFHVSASTSTASPLACSPGGTSDFDRRSFMSGATQQLGLHCLASDTPMSDCTYAARGYEAHCDRLGQKTIICLSKEAHAKGFQSGCARALREVRSIGMLCPHPTRNCGPDWPANLFMWRSTFSVSPIAQPVKRRWVFRADRLPEHEHRREGFA